MAKIVQTAYRVSQNTKPRLEVLFLPATDHTQEELNVVLAQVAETLVEAWQLPKQRVSTMLLRPRQPLPRAPVLTQPLPGSTSADAPPLPPVSASVPAPRSTQQPLVVHGQELQVEQTPSTPTTLKTPPGVEDDF